MIEMPSKMVHAKICAYALDFHTGQGDREFNVATGGLEEDGFKVPVILRMNDVIIIVIIGVIIAL